MVTGGGGEGFCPLYSIFIFPYEPIMITLGTSTTNKKRKRNETFNIFIFIVNSPADIRTTVQTEGG
jgi:hypothetical protein